MTQPLRILMLVSDAHGGFGGIAQYNRNLIAALSHIERVTEVVVLPRIAEHRHFDVPGKIIYDLRGLGSLRHYLARCLAQVMRARFDLVICGHINLSPVGVLAARLSRAPSLLVIHGIDAWSPPPGRAAARCASMVSQVVAVSEFTRERFLSWCPFDRARSSIVTNSIDASAFGLGPKAHDLVARHGLEGARVVMTFGRMSHDECYKGFDEVIGVLPRLLAADPSIRYLAAGDGTDRPRLEALARDRGVADKVIFTGRIPETRKADYLRLANAYVMPSSGEGFGIVILEALACGIPVVASSADATQEAVRHGEMGQVVDPKDTDRLERAILEALSRPKEVQPGLAAFSFANFETQVRAAIGNVVRF